MGEDHAASEVFGNGGGTDGSGQPALGDLDSSGFLGGSGTCPGFAPVMYLDVNILPSDGICSAAAMLANFILAMAYVLAALIIARVKAGS
jgi:hypothetical protein